MWANINKDVFIYHICKHLDGRDGSRLRLVCKQWDELIKRCPQLMLKIKYHYIQIYDSKLLPKLLCSNEFNIISFDRSDYIAENILWYKYGFNPYLMHITNNYDGLVTSMRRFVYIMGYRI